MVWRSQTSYIDYPCPLCTELSSDSLNLFMTLYVLDYFIYKVFATSQIAEPLPIFTSEKLCLFKLLFLYRIMFLTCCQLTELAATYSSNFFSLVVPPSHVFLDMLLPPNSRWENALHEVENVSLSASVIFFYVLL